MVFHVRSRGPNWVDAVATNNSRRPMVTVMRPSRARCVEPSAGATAGASSEHHRLPRLEAVINNPVRGCHSPTYGGVLSSTSGQSSLAHRLPDWS
jgi:hypothetical protein